MKLIYTLPFLLLLLASTHSHGQKQEDFRAVNVVWSSFYQAFESLDYTQMAKIHHPELVRISGGRRIIDYDTYIDGYKNQFAKSKENGTTSRIELRFFERLNNGTNASERGIYKLIRNENKAEEKTYYGQFHVLMTKENGQWLITMDYDSNEGDTIGEEKYLSSYAIDDFKPFLPSK